MNIAIASIGLATAQGSVFDITHEAALRTPAQLPWLNDRRTTCHRSYRAVGVGPSLNGGERWSALARQALGECFGGDTPSARTPVLVASCNGAAVRFDPDNWRHAFDSKMLLEGTPWAKNGLPIFSASCSSGLHALYMAKLLLLAGCSDDAVVLAVDILSQASHDNFEVLRLLTGTPTPWQAESRGFIPGEAAVALRLVRARNATG
ncbi:MAG TPA: beta-ketoacyl synthase N-terminal-like domain-containing protein, partial [Pyrinomonadaceae bacterium]